MLATSRTALTTSLLLACLTCLACTADEPAEPSTGEQPTSEPAPEHAPTSAVAMLTPYFEIGEQLATDRSDGLDLLGRAVIGSTAQVRNEPGIDRMHAAAERLGVNDLEAARGLPRHEPRAARLPRRARRRA